MFIKKIAGWTIVAIIILFPGTFISYTSHIWWTGIVVEAITLIIGVPSCILLNIILTKCFKN
jgi:hypothetical protein